MGKRKSRGVFCGPRGELDEWGRKGILRMLGEEEGRDKGEGKA